MDRELNKEWIAQGLKLAEDVSIFGKSMMNLTREEAIAIVAHLWICESQPFENPSHQIELLFDLMKEK